MKVKLDEVIEAMEFAGMESEYYYDTSSEEILLVFDGMVNGEDNPELIEEIENGFIEDFIPLPGQYDIHEYGLMEEFIDTLPEGRKKNILEEAIIGRGAFRRFKDALYDLGIEKQWYQYHDRAYEKIAREWCEKYGIKIEK